MVRAHKSQLRWSEQLSKNSMKDGSQEPGYKRLQIKTIQNYAVENSEWSILTLIF